MTNEAGEINNPREASMKVPPKRKGNHIVLVVPVSLTRASMKVPPKRKGNINHFLLLRNL